MSAARRADRADATRDASATDRAPPDAAAASTEHERQPTRARQTTPPLSEPRRPGEPRPRTPLRLRLPRRAPERREVDADQRPGRAEGRHHLVAPADHPAHRARHRAPPRRPARPGRHPGLHRPRTLLGQRLNDLVRETLAEVDVVALLHPGRREDRPRRPVHRRASWPRSRARRRSPGHQDRQGRPRQQVAEQLIEVDALGEQAARRLRRRRPGLGEGRLPGRRRRRRAHSPTCRRARRCTPTGELTDEPEAVMVAELVREAALEGVRDELPHTLAVVVEEMAPSRRGPAVRQAAARRAWCSTSSATARRASSSASGGAGCKDVGTRARHRHRGAAGHAGAPRPAGQGRQGLAARPQAAGRASASERAPRYG